MAWGNVKAAWPHKGNPRGNPVPTRIATATASASATEIFEGSGMRYEQVGTTGTALLCGSGTLQSGNVFAGVAAGNYSWTAGEDAQGLTNQKYVKLHTEGSFWFYNTDGTTAVATHLGKTVYESADETYGPCAVTFTQGNGVGMGVVVDVDTDNDRVLVKIDGFAGHGYSISV